MSQVHSKVLTTMICSADIHGSSRGLTSSEGCRGLQASSAPVEGGIIQKSLTNGRDKLVHEAAPATSGVSASIVLALVLRNHPLAGLAAFRNGVRGLSDALDDGNDSRRDLAGNFRDSTDSLHDVLRRV
jgi:hypothetical protein